MPRKRKRYKIPNGKGSITELKRKNGTLFWIRKPGIMLPDGKYYRESLGSYESYEEAYQVLIDGDIKASSNSSLNDFLELYLTQNHSKQISERTRNEYKLNIKKFTPYIYMPISEVKQFMLQSVIDDLIINGYAIEKNGKEIVKFYSPSTLRKIITSISKAYETAIDNEAIDVNLAKRLKITTDRKPKETKPFSLEFVNSLFPLADDGDIEVMKLLVNIYTGLRPQEFLLLEKKHVDFEHGYIHDMGMKTETGRSRKVPILPKIEKHLKILYFRTNRYIFGKKIDVDKFRDRWFYPLIERLGCKDDVTPKSCRKTFSYILHHNEVDKEVIKQIMGHVDYSTTSKHYIPEDIQRSIQEVKSKII